MANVCLYCFFLRNDRIESIETGKSNVLGYAMYTNVLMSSSCRLIYLCSMSHSICSFIIFLLGKNIFFSISTNSVCNWALFIFFLIFSIFIIASCDIKRPLINIRDFRSLFSTLPVLAKFSIVRWTDYLPLYFVLWTVGAFR